MSKIRSLLEVVEFGIALDWATFSAPSEEGQSAQFGAFAREYMRREKERWQHSEEQKLGAYVGIRIGDTSHVRRAYDGHEMLIATGEESNRLAEEVIIHEIPTRPTRLDVRATARTEKAAPRYPEELREFILRVRKEAGKECNKKMALFDGGLGCTGITIGSRSSECYGRIYDHDAKHNKHATAKIWAHEAEYKGDSARGLFDGYKGAENRTKYLAGVTRRRLEKWNVPCPWLGEHDKISIMRGHKATTDEQRLAYIDSVVLPMLSGLVERGRKDELEVLIKKHGLDKLFGTAR